jgi:hypothetical protein
MPALYDDCGMTTTELCESTGVTPRELQNWIENGLLDAEMVGRNSDGGVRMEFTAAQAERPRLIKALQNKGAKLSQLARADLADLAGKAFVVFDGSELRACPDAAHGDRHGGTGQAAVPAVDLVWPKYPN